MTLSDASFLVLYQVMDGEVAQCGTAESQPCWVTTGRDNDRICTLQVEHLIALGLVELQEWDGVTAPTVTDAGRRLLRDRSVYEVLDMYKRT